VNETKGNEENLTSTTNEDRQAVSPQKIIYVYYLSMNLTSNQVFEGILVSGNKVWGNTYKVTKILGENRGWKSSIWGIHNSLNGENENLIEVGMEEQDMLRNFISILPLNYQQHQFVGNNALVNIYYNLIDRYYQQIFGPQFQNSLTDICVGKANINIH